MHKFQTNLIRIHSENTRIAKLLGLGIAILFFILFFLLILFIPSVLTIVIALALGSLIFGYIRGFWLRLSKVMYDPKNNIIFVEPEGISIELKDIQKIRLEAFGYLSLFPVCFIEYKSTEAQSASVCYISKKIFVSSITGSEIERYFTE